MRGIFGGQGLIDYDRLFFPLGGASGAALPALLSARRDFAIATLDDARVYIIGGRSGAGQGLLITGANTILEFNPRTNVVTPKSSSGFTPRHSLGAAAVKTSSGHGSTRSADTLLPAPGRDPRQDSIAVWIAAKVFPSPAPVLSASAAALHGR